jgi:hypothetical protein
MTTWLGFCISAVAVCALAFGLYLPRHHRSDLAAAYLVIGLGLSMIMVTLKQATTIGAGFGLGILGVLSVFRLRSIVIDHHDVAYFFATLSIAIVGGLTVTPQWLTAVFCAALLVALFVSDHPRLSSVYLHQVVLLDRIFTEESAVAVEVSALLNAQIRRVEIRELDLLKQTTLVEVRYRHPRTASE